MHKKTIQNGNSSITFIEEGVGEPLIFIHGWSVTPRIYEDIIKTLGTRFHVIAPFMRGIVSFDKRVEHLALLCNALNLSKSIIIGHSSSGIDAILFARKYKDKTKALVLVDTLGFPFKRSIADWIGVWLKHIYSFSLGREKEAFSFTAKLTGDFLSQLVEYPLILIKELRNVLDKDVREDFKKISVPILFISARDDILIPVYIIEQASELNPKAVFQMVDGDHNWIKLHPKLFLDCLESFLKSI